MSCYLKTISKNQRFVKQNTEINIPLSHILTMQKMKNLKTNFTYSQTQRREHKITWPGIALGFVANNDPQIFFWQDCIAPPAGKSVTKGAAKTYVGPPGEAWSDTPANQPPTENAPILFLCGLAGSLPERSLRRRAWVLPQCVGGSTGGNKKEMLTTASQSTKHTFITSTDQSSKC